MITATHRAGPHEPLEGAPPRAPGSIRRTSHLDSTRASTTPRVVGRARDLRTAPDGTTAELAAVELGLDVEGLGTITAVHATPDVPGLDQLVGLSAAAGFRGPMTAALPLEAEARTALHLLLDDLPGAWLVAGYGASRAVPGPAPASARTREHVARITDTCAGWVEDGSILVEFRAHDEIPTPMGPPAPPLGRDDDPLAWHELHRLPSGATRRSRRLDLVREAPTEASFEAHFRDSYAEGDDDESVVHEYTVTGRLDTVTRTITAIEAQPRVLPWVECPVAIASARRVLGTPVDDLRRRVRAELVGTSTCTHLNDTLRMLADLEALVTHLP